MRVDVAAVSHPIKIALPWTFPLGAALTLALGLVLGRTPNEPAISPPIGGRVDSHRTLADAAG